MTPQLTQKQIRLLRRVQRFLLKEPRRFNMEQGIRRSSEIDSILQAPPCGTACCIAGAAYAISTKTKLNNSSVDWYRISLHMDILGLSGSMARRLFYIAELHPGTIPGKNAWTAPYAELYMEAKTPYERAHIGVARIEHFIATDGAE